MCVRLSLVACETYAGNRVRDLLGNIILHCNSALTWISFFVCPVYTHRIVAILVYGTPNAWHLADTVQPSRFSGKYLRNPLPALTCESKWNMDFANASALCTTDPVNGFTRRTLYPQRNIKTTCVKKQRATLQVPNRCEQQQLDCLNGSAIVRLCAITACHTGTQKRVRAEHESNAYRGGGGVIVSEHVYRRRGFQSNQFLITIITI